MQIPNNNQEHCGMTLIVVNVANVVQDIIGHNYETKHLKLNFDEFMCHNFFKPLVCVSKFLCE